MRTTFFVIALGFLLLVPRANAQVATYLFDAPCPTTCNSPGPDCPGVGNQNATSLNTSVIGTASAFTVSPSLSSGTATCSLPGFTTPMNGFAAGNPANPSRARWASGWTTGVAANASHYFTATLTAATYATVGITRIDLDESRSLTGPHMCQVMVSTNNGMSFTLLWQGIIPDNANWRSWSITSLNALAPMPTFTNTLIVRFQGFASEAGTGTWRVDNIRFYANIVNLPISLLSFKGRPEKDRVMLSWETATETNNDYFTIEKSLDGVSWEPIGTVPGAGTSLFTNTYEFPDFHPDIGTNYYRLSQTDYDGTHVVVGTIAVMWGVDDGLTRILDACGKVIMDWSETHALTDMPPGIYMLQSRYETKRIVIP